MSIVGPKYRFSKDCYSFSKITYQNRLAQNPDDTEARDMIEYYERLFKDDVQKTYSHEFRQTLEYALRTSDELCAKVAAKDSYAQNLYAALCNNDFSKDGVSFFCSWRAAGRIVANMRQKGDYIDWYCSGIIPDDGENLTEQTKERIKNYVPEGLVTPEIKSDIESLGWKIFGVSNAESSNTENL